jgi:hypothetical protein
MVNKKTFAFYRVNGSWKCICFILALRLGCWMKIWELFRENFCGLGWILKTRVRLELERCFTSVYRVFWVDSIFLEDMKGKFRKIPTWRREPTWKKKSKFKIFLDHVKRTKAPSSSNFWNGIWLLIVETNKISVPFLSLTPAHTLRFYLKKYIFL